MLEHDVSLSVLFVDDEETIRKNYTLFLEQVFQNVYQASDGEEAYRLYMEHKPDIVIVDINLPKMNGLELLQKIKSHKLDTKAVVMSAHTDTEQQLHRYGLEGITCMIKPVSRKMFHTTLQKLMEH